jgi:hypothetical protein
MQDPLAPLGSRSAAVLCFAGSSVDLEKVLEELKRWWGNLAKPVFGDGSDVTHKIA